MTWTHAGHPKWRVVLWDWALCLWSLILPLDRQCQNWVEFSVTAWYLHIASWWGEAYTHTHTLEFGPGTFFSRTPRAQWSRYSKVESGWQSHPVPALSWGSLQEESLLPPFCHNVTRAPRLQRKSTTWRWETEILPSDSGCYFPEKCLQPGDQGWS